MRFRIRFAAFLLVFLVVLPIFCIFLGDYLSRNEVAIFGDDYELPPPKTSEKTFDSGIIQQSVLLGYSNADKLSIFSAFTNNGTTTVILSSYGYLNRRVYCRLFDEQKREISGKFVSVFPEFTVKCSTSSPSTTRFVAVTVNKKDVPENFHRTSSAQNRKSAMEISEFGVCLAPIFGESPKVLMLIEFIEFYILQGADTFLIYTFDISPETEKLLNFYKNRIKLQIIHIGNTTKCLNRHRCRHEMQLQDCIFRSQNVAKWVATVDLDERIMPINEDSRIIDLLQSEPKNVGELRFRCQWTLRYSEIPKGPPKIDNLPMMTWHNTSHVAPQNHTTKSIIRPFLVDSMGVHGVLKFAKMDFPPQIRLVDPEIAVVRHYRLISGWSYFLKEAESFGDFFDFRISQKLSGLILQRVSTIIGAFSGEK